MRIVHPAERGIPLIVHLAVIYYFPLACTLLAETLPVPDAGMPQERPHLRQAEIQYRVNTHEPWPQSIRQLKGRERRAVRICASRPDEDRAAGGVVV